MEIIKSNILNKNLLTPDKSFFKKLKTSVVEYSKDGDLAIYEINLFYIFDL
jgi:hypothetical protein